jgi:Uma2 family endonuclease
VAIDIQRRKLSVPEWDRIIASGALPEDDRVELIDGEILEMSPIGPRHAACVGRLTGLFAGPVADNVVLWVQNPVAIADFDEPQPDVALLWARDDGYAAAGVREFWLVDLNTVRAPPRALTAPRAWNQRQHQPPPDASGGGRPRRPRRNCRSTREVNPARIRGRARCTSHRASAAVSAPRRDCSPPRPTTDR